MEVVALLAFLVFVVWLGWLLRKADGDAPGFPGRRLVWGSSQPRSRSGPARRCSRRCGARTTDSPTSWRQPLDTNGAAFGLTWALDALMLAAAGGVIMMTRCAPRWLGWSALAIAVLSMVAVATPSAPFGFLLALLWFVVAGITFAWRGAPESAAMPRPAPA